ncbi:MAG: hypothetical protein JNK72_18335 [Myxococcales bacterium]|nr:hypothetical protein [Myxococcales bacterium]
MTATAVLVVASKGEGVTTRSFSLDTVSELSAGTLDRVAVRSDGTVVLSRDLTRVAPAENVSSVWALLDLGDGTALAATGVDGAVYRIANGQATRYAETDALVITSLTRGDDGRVYAGSLPDGKLYRLDAPSNNRPGRAEVVAELPGVQHIWAVHYDRARRVVLCATGPEGKLFAVDPRAPRGSNATVLFDSEEPHLYAMTQGPSGEVFVGAGGGHALVYGVRNGVTRVVARVAGDEVKALVAVGDELWVAGNEFTEPPEAPRRSVAQGRAPSPGGSSGGRPRPGKGSVYRVRASGLSERYYYNPDGHITALEFDPAQRELYAALAVGGRVVAIGEDRLTRVAFDVDESAVSALALTGRGALFATSDSGAFYTVSRNAPQDAQWYSKALDAGVVARWGLVRWRGVGNLDWESRSGNSDTPDATWSPWAPLAASGTITSPGGRYVQVRARFGRDADSQIRAVTVFYLPENQRAVLTEVSASAAETKTGESRSATLRLAWKVENPDADALRYRLRYRADAESAWRPLLRNQDWLSTTSFDWPTDGVPEGWYRVEVEASDEASNYEDTAQRDRRESEPVLVDNTPPTVTLAGSGASVTGTVEDASSSVTRLEWSLDGAEWRPLRARDGVLDQRSEAFSVTLSGLTPGPHTVAVRAYDEAGNLGNASTRVTTR